MKTQYSTLRTALLWCCTALASLQLAAWGATLANRWSFNETSGTTATDSVGGKNGTLMQGASFDGLGSCVLNNGGNGFVASSNPACQYVAFPANLVTGYTAITVETWVRPEFDDAAFMDWNRLWDFGNQDEGLTNGYNYFFFRAGSSAYGIGGAIMTSNLNFQGQNPVGVYLLGDGQTNHVVWCSDGASGKLKMYVNGVVAAAYDGFTNTPAMVGPTTNNWLGRSLFNVDRALDADYDEFRIYNGMLTPLEVAANCQSGPDTTNASYGTVTSITLQVDSTIAIGATRVAQLWASASGLNNTIDIHDMPGVTYTSGNTNILRVDAYGTVVGVAAGTTNVVAKYGSLSSTQSVVIVSLPTRLVHRYSFTSDASDSIGGASGDGTFYNTSGQASISGGQLNLVGQAYDFVYLPPYILAPSNILNGALTFMAWMTPATNNGAWARLFDFGATEPSGVGARYIFFAPNNATNGAPVVNSRAAVSDVSPGSGSEDQVTGPSLFGQANAHVAVAWNPSPARKFFGLFLNGFLVSSMTTTKPYSSINNTNSYLGRSAYTVDPWLNGSINEFRIYDGELDGIQIATAYQYGPDSTNLDPGAFVSFTNDCGPSTMELEQIRQAACYINFVNATNVNVLGYPALTLTSDNTNVLTITSPGGLIRALGLGTATLTASFYYAALTNTYTSSATISTFIPPATLLHRYSFSTTAGSSSLVVTDSISGANGVISSTNTLGPTNFSWTGTNLSMNLRGAASNWDTYVALPAGIISSLTSNATFEAWVTTPNATLYNFVWARIFDFGSLPGQPDIFLTRRTTTANQYPRFDWLTGFMDANSALASTEFHIVVLYADADNSAEMYINGVLAAQSSSVTTALPSLNDTNNWLGRSHFSMPFILVETNADPYLRGTYNEFRIYSGLLTVAEIQRNYALGPDTLITNTLLYYTNIGAGYVSLYWTNYAARFNLEFTAVLGTNANWTPAAGTLSEVSGTNLMTFGTNYYKMNVQTTNAARFFRLKRTGY